MRLLLQTGLGNRLVVSGDSTTMITMGILVAGLFIGLIVAGVITNRRAANKRVGHKGTPRRTPRTGSFRRQATKLGLSKLHIAALEFISKRYEVKDPNTLLDNPSVLDSYLSRAIAGIDELKSSDANKEAQKHTLYRIKQIIERNSQRTVSVTSSRQLAINQNISVSTNSGDRRQSRVISILKESMAIEVPVADTGNQVRWKKWTRVKVYFWRDNGEGYSFETKLIGYNTIKGISSAFLQHSDRVAKSKQRKYRRRTLDRPCYFYPVRIVTAGTGKKQTKKAYVETQRGALGTVLEVSAGGCSIRSSRSLRQGALLKVDFETNRGTPVASYGKVVQTRKEDVMGYIMHIMFTKVSRTHLNSINAFVYDFDDAG
jgi:hypothetical protein